MMDVMDGMDGGCPLMDGGKRGTFRVLCCKA